GRAGAYVLSKEKNGSAKILIGMDTRISGQMLEAALVAGVCSVGAEVVCVGVAPTPAIAYFTRTHGFDAGIVVSASHNSYEFNGIKFFNSQGYKLPDATEDEIEKYILGEAEMPQLPTHGGIGRMRRGEYLLDEYIDFAVSTVKVDLKGTKIALDCANGASSVTSPAAFRRMGAEVLVINNDPDGVNINNGCGSTHIEGLQKFVTDNGCDFGFAFDGDADRVLAVDNKGGLIDGDVIMAVCGNAMKQKGTLRGNTIVATVMSNLGLFIMGEKQGIHIEKTKVGDRYVLEEMLKSGYSLGGEQSGHIIFLEHNTTGDGLVSALNFAQVVKESGKTVDELCGVITILPQVLENAHVAKSGDTRYAQDEDITAAIARLEEKFSGRGRVLIRPSGTEPLVRVMIEGEDIEEITADAEALKELIEKKLS
ncbi:MAG: phosphoglucosamine mutase, partial [Clostridia bacterium]